MKQFDSFCFKMVEHDGKIVLRIQNEIYTVSNDIPPNTSLNSFIRDYTGLKGTKFMCLEGGCGSCIVFAKRIHPYTKKEISFAVNSCLIPIFTCNGWTIITIEGIGNKYRGYNKVQTTLAKFSGTQCGYCSPGMCMNMYSLMNSGTSVTAEQVENSFGGNICRCTGYRPILDAFKSLASNPPKCAAQCADIEDLIPPTNRKMSYQRNSVQVSSCHQIMFSNEVENVDNEQNSNEDETTTDVVENKEDILPKIDPLPEPSFCFRLGADKTRWYKLTEIKEIYAWFQTIGDGSSYMLLAGNTAQGAYRSINQVDVYGDINDVPTLKSNGFDSGNFIIGANTTLAETMILFYKTAEDKPNQFTYLKQIADHIDRVANVPVRNVGTLAGNLSIKHTFNEFPSDIFLTFETAGAQLKIGDTTGIEYMMTIQEYLVTNMRKKIIISIHFPPYDNSTYIFKSYKIMRRAQNTIAYVNAGFLFKVDKSNKFKVLEKPSIVFGGISPKFIHATGTENFLNGKQLINSNTIKQACGILQSEVNPTNVENEASPYYRKMLAVGLLYKFFLSLSPNSVSGFNRSGGNNLKRPISSGKQDTNSDPSVYPLTKPIPKLEAVIQCSGEAEYINDIPQYSNELYASFVLSDKGPAKINSIDASEALKIDGVVAFLQAKDIPGKNTFTAIFEGHEEKLFEDKEVTCAGQAVGIIIAKTQIIANNAASKVKVNLTLTRKPMIKQTEIVDSGDKSRIVLESTLDRKGPEGKDKKYKFEGSFKSWGQYHFTMETQTCYCVPTDDGMDVFPSTQDVTNLQANVAIVLAIPTNRVNVQVKRVGGAYGCKLSRSAMIATACAVAANNRQAPVRMVMNIETNMESIGKRMPLYAKYKVSVNEDGVIQSLDIDTYNDHGYVSNEIIVFQLIKTIPNVYNSKTWKVNGYRVNTDTPVNTFCRAPGSMDAIAIIEYIMEHIAAVVKKDAYKVRLGNFDPDYYKSTIKPIMDEMKVSFDLENRKKQVEKFNKENRWKKKGISLVFMKFTYSFMFTYHAIVSIYAADGTVDIVHGGIEIGQGINTKLAQACAYTLGISLDMVRLKPTHAYTSPNDSFTADSSATDGTAYAVVQCCKKLLKRLEPIKEKNPGLEWKDLIFKAYEEQVDLCAESMFSIAEASKTGIQDYKIPGIGITEVEIDVLTGEVQIIRSDVFEDVGRSMNPTVDVGQMEGAFVMGLGFWMLEELIYAKETGKLLTNRTWNYTPPGAKDIPIDFRIYFRKNAATPYGVLRAKVVQEPALCLAVGVVFAIRNAIESARKNAGDKQTWFELKVPYTPENIMTSCLNTVDQFIL